MGGVRVMGGSNDVSAAFLVVLALALLCFADRDTRFGRAAFVLSAGFLGWAVAFKQFNVVLLPLVVRHLAVSGPDWRRYGLVSVGVAAAFVLPFFLWAPRPLLPQQLAPLTFRS